MKRYRLTGDYGTFTIQRVVECDNDDDAWEQTGIATDLIAIGWNVIEWPDGEEWLIEEEQEDGTWLER